MKMTANDWTNMLPYFTTKENWGDPFQMKRELLYELKAFREYVGKSIHINCGYETSGHSSESQHKLGNAIDGYVKEMSLFDQLMSALRFKFKGIGVYPFWNTPGLHLDMRVNATHRALWWRDKNGKYQSFNKELFKILEKL